MLFKNAQYARARQQLGFLASSLGAGIWYTDYFSEKQLNLLKNCFQLPSQQGS